MNDIIFNNDIKVTVIQSPEIAENGDTIEFSAIPELLFAAENREQIENYSFTYVWMVSYDGGLSYKKIGTNTDKLILENINTKIFNNSIYKVKVVLEDLEDFLLTESGDRILTQIGEILLFNSNNVSLSIQSDPVTNDTTVTSIDNISDIENIPLNFLNIEGTIDDALSFDTTITEDVRAEILSLQSRIDIDNQARSLDGEATVDASLPDTPNTDIILPSETLSTQATCWTPVKKTIGSGPIIQYEVCKPGGSTYLWWNCNSSNANTYDSEQECESATNACQGSIEDPCIGRFALPDAVANTFVTFANIRFLNCTGSNCTMCCDSIETVCDTTEPWNLCEQEFSKSMPTRLSKKTALSTTYYKNYDYAEASDKGGYPSDNQEGSPHSPPCGSAINCIQEDYVPEPVIGGQFSISNDCSGRGSGWGSDNLADDNPDVTTVWHADEKLSYCNRHCKGEYTEVNAPGLLPRLAGWAPYLFYLVYYIGGAWTGGYFVRTYCDKDGKLNSNILPTQLDPAVIKKCTLKICKKKLVCAGERKDKYYIKDGRQLGAWISFSRVDKDGGASITVDGTTYKSDKLIAPNTDYEIFDGPPPYECSVAGGSITFMQDSTGAGTPWANGDPDHEDKKNCRWRVASMCCPTGSNCSYKIKPDHEQKYPGTYPTYNFDATNRVFDRSKLYSIDRSGSLDFVKPGLCNAVCSGRGCEVYEKWRILDIDQQEVSCNEDFDIIVLDQIKDQGHGKNGSETTIFTDSKCVNDSTPAKRKIKIAKIVKRYTYDQPGINDSYDNVMREVYRRLGYTPGDDQIYANAYLVKYEEQPLSLPETMLQIGAVDPTDTDYIKKQMDFDDGQFIIVDRRRVPKKTPLYRHSAILLTDRIPLSRWCECCEPLYLVSKANPLEYPCNDRNYSISGCRDENGDPLPLHYGECLKDSSTKSTKIKIVTITEIKEPTREMIKLSKKPNTDYFKSVEAAKAEGSKRVGSTGIVCAGSSIT